MEAVQERLGGLVQEAQETVTHVVVVTVAEVDQAVALDRGLLAQQQVVHGHWVGIACNGLGAFRWYVPYEYFLSFYIQE